MRTYILAAVAGASLVGPVTAADLYIEDPAPVIVPTGGWYLRGYMGMSNQQLGSLEHEDFSIPPLSRAGG